ncbi:MAG: protein kinase [Gemmatimonadales bacterium]
MATDSSRLASALQDRYRIERELGQGGMATVYLAEDLKHKRKVALKVLKPELAAVLGAERFVQEITTTAALQHPHILPLFDSGTADGFLYYVMPFIDGETLRSKLDRETQLGIAEAVRITTAVADALDYAHRQGVIHRDIKPENILLHDGRPMVADFGIALALSAAAGGRMTETGLSLGTPHYMSPEQATAEKEITARSDIYSLGSVLYEMLAGSPPHVGPSAQQIIMKIVTEAPAPVSGLRKSVPPNVAAAVMKSLEKLPADRFATAKEFAESLANPGFTAAGTAAGGVTGYRVGAGVSRRAFAGVAAMAILLLATTIWGWFGSRRPIVPGSAWQLSLAFPDSARPSSVMSLSPDGSTLAYTVDGPRGGQIWVRRADALSPRPVPGTEGGSWPAISPDGRRLAFHARRGLFVVPLEGGTPAVVTDSTQLADFLAWSDADHIVLANATGLFRIAANGGPLERLTTVDTAAGEGYHLSPSALPDGKGMVFLVTTKSLDPGATRVAVVGPKGGRHTILTPGLFAAYAPPGHLLVKRADGTISAFPFDPSARRITGPAVPVVAGLSVGTFSLEGDFSVTAAGRMVYTVGSGLPVFDLAAVDRRGQAQPVDPGWTGNFESVALSPDGRRIAAGMQTSAAEEIQVRNLADRSTVRVEMSGLQLRDPAFSPDGRTLAFAGLAAPASGLYRVSPGTGQPPEAILTTSFPVAAVRYAPDGQELYYTSYGTGRSEILVHHLGSAETSDRQVAAGETSAGGAPSPDGRWLAYLSVLAGSAGLYVRSTDPSRGERWEVAPPGTPRLGRPSWSRDGHELFYTAADSLVAAQVSTASGFVITSRRALFSITGFESRFDIFPDGRFLMIHHPSASGGVRLIMLDDWKAALAR